MWTSREKEKLTQETITTIKAFPPALLFFSSKNGTKKLLLCPDAISPEPCSPTCFYETIMAFS